VADARPDPGALSAGVAFTAEELGDLGLQRGLQDQSGAKAGDVLEDLAEVALGGEQSINVSTNTVGG
jgi:hypothetical protein